MVKRWLVFFARQQFPMTILGWAVVGKNPIYWNRLLRLGRYCIQVVINLSWFQTQR